VSARARDRRADGDERSFGRGRAVSFTIVQKGARRGPLVVGFHVGADKLRSAVQSTPLRNSTVLVALASSYSAPPTWETMISTTRAAGWEEGPVVLVGWSAGCAALRAYLRAEKHPACVVALDGTSGPAGQVPAGEWAIAPWRDAAKLARAGDVLLVLSHTYQVYTEKLPPAERFPATVNVVRAATGWELLEPAPHESPRETREGDLVALSCSSKDIDKQAHMDQQNITMAHALARYVAPWIGARWREKEPARDGTGDAALEVAQALLGRGEEPPGSNAGPFIRECFAGAVRGDRNGDGIEDPIGITSGEWCAAFVGLCDSRAGVQRAWRASVRELCSDASKAGMLREVGAYKPRPGDLAIFARNGQDPRRGGLGHVGRVESFDAKRGSFVTIDGNHGSTVARVERTFAGLVAWIELPHREARAERWDAPAEVLGNVVRVSDAASGRTSAETFVSRDEGPVIG
jgi:hypothetical protein